MAEKRVTFSRGDFPKDGVLLSLPPGKVLTRIHLDLGKDGITLASVGAASAALKGGRRQHLTLKPSKDGVSLALVGAASATK